MVSEAAARRERRKKQHEREQQETEDETSRIEKLEKEVQTLTKMMAERHERIKNLEANMMKMQKEIENLVDREKPPTPRTRCQPEVEASPERGRWADMEGEDVLENVVDNENAMDNESNEDEEAAPNDSTEKKQKELGDDADFEKYESKSQKKKKKKKKKDEEEEVKRVSDDDRLKEMMGEDMYHQLKEMFATFRSDMKSAFKEMLRSNPP